MRVLIYKSTALKLAEWHGGWIFTSEELAAPSVAACLRSKQALIGHVNDRGSWNGLDLSKSDPRCPPRVSIFRNGPFTTT